MYALYASRGAAQVSCVQRRAQDVMQCRKSRLASEKRVAHMSLVSSADDISGPTARKQYDHASA